MNTATRIIRGIEHIHCFFPAKGLPLVIYLGESEFKELTSLYCIETDTARVKRDEFAGYPVVRVDRPSYLAVHLNESPFNDKP